MQSRVSLSISHGKMRLVTPGSACGFERWKKMRLALQKINCLKSTKRRGRGRKCDRLLGKRVAGFNDCSSSVYSKHAFSASDQTPLRVCLPLRLETDTKHQKYFAGLNNDNGYLCTLDIYGYTYFV